MPFDGVRSYSILSVRVRMQLRHVTSVRFRIVDYAISQRPDLRTRNLDDVTGYKKNRRIKTRTGAIGGAGRDDITRLQRIKNRQVTDEVIKGTSVWRSCPADGVRR